MLEGRGFCFYNSRVRVKFLEIAERNVQLERC